ncbi:ParB-like protein [Bdellovibrio sp. HCB185ZH]|uniref:ParB-like protein n=1 Tax=Bdellovibrio sp. HCB185ZH TaxID=3394235 RepID=UPI0039A5395A
MKTTIQILKLRPTQMALGMEEVSSKIKKLKRLTPEKLQKELRSNPITTVKAPNGHYYVVDGHHRLFSYWSLGIKKIPIEVIKVFGKTVGFESFWKQMLQHHWAHPFDLSGSGPQNPLYLSQNIRGLENDPYRSLAWLVRAHKGYKKTEVTFADFKWAQYFRKHKIIEPNFEVNYQKHLPRALQLAQGKGAKKLPGYIGKKSE